MARGHLQIIVCGGGPATDVGRLIEAAHAWSWTVAVTATSSALPFLDLPAIEESAGGPVRSSYQTPLAARAPFRRALADLRGEGVRVLSGPDDGWEPHPPGTGSDIRALFPWQAAFQLAKGCTSART